VFRLEPKWPWCHLSSSSQCCAKICMLQRVCAKHIYTKPFRSLMGPPPTCDVLGGHPTVPVEARTCVCKCIHVYVFWRQDCATRYVNAWRVRSCVCCCHGMTPNMSVARNKISSYGILRKTGSSCNLSDPNLMAFLLMF
jgi:hypothetical protein